MTTAQDSCKEAPCSCFVMRATMEHITMPAVVPDPPPPRGPVMPGRVVKARYAVVVGAHPSPVWVR